MYKMKTQVFIRSAKSEHDMLSNYFPQIAFRLIIVMCVINVSGQVKKKKLYGYSIQENRALKKSLGFYEDTYLNFTELATKYNYKTETYEVTTADGYILTLFRILSKCADVKPHPVLLVHGIIDNSDVWIVPGPKTGIGYVLSNNCFDVWAGNHRGNHYSRKHVRLDPNTDPEYWNYSFDEHGNYDIPAFVNFILQTSKQSKIIYMGHSQGTTDFFAMTTLRPEYNDKVALSIHLAPVAGLANIMSPLPLLAANWTPYIKSFLDGAGFYEILARDQVLHFISEFLCQVNPDLFCGEILAITTGYSGRIPSKLLAVAFGHEIDGISTKSLAHLGQLIATKTFRRYNEGRKGNIKRYGRPEPPSYNLSEVTSPVVLIVGRNDWISTVKDMKILRSQLPNVVKSYVVPDETFSHHTLVWGTQAPEYVFPLILEYLNKYS